MRKKTDNSPVLSFFSFQDIITSVTGIMFLVVILIILLIFEQQARKAIHEAKSSASVQVKTDIGKLRKQIADLRSSLKDTQARLRENLQEVERLKKLNPEAIMEKLQKFQVENVRLAEAIEKVRKERETAARKLVKIRAEKEKTAVALSEAAKENKTIEKDFDDQKKRLEELRKQAVNRKTIAITYDRNESKTPILVECSKNGVRAKAYDSKDIRDFQIPSAVHYAESLAKFMEWAQTVDASSYYFVLFARPSAFGYVEALSMKLKAAGKERGIEILPDDKSTLF